MDVVKHVYHGKARYIPMIVYSGGKKGKYPLLSEAIKGGLFHPNCRHIQSTYYGDILKDEPINEEEVNPIEQQKRILHNQIQQVKDLKKVHLIQRI